MFQASYWHKAGIGVLELGILSWELHGFTATVDSLGRDRYQRVLGHVHGNGVDANAEMVVRGMACHGMSVHPEQH